MICPKDLFIYFGGGGGHRRAGGKESQAESALSVEPSTGLDLVTLRS